MKFQKHVKIRVPTGLKIQVAEEATSLGMTSSGFIRFVLFDAIKEGRVITSIPTVQCDGFLKFKVPVEFMVHIRKQADVSHIPVSTYIRVLLHEAVQNNPEGA